MKKYQYILAALALLCIVAGSIRGAMSYFTTYCRALGGRTLNLVEETTIKEVADSNLKKLTVENPKTSVPVYVRAKAYAGGDYELTYTSKGGNWTEIRKPEEGEEIPDEETYSYFFDKDTGKHAILYPGKNTGEPLVVAITRKIDENTNPDSTFNVVVVYEAVPVIYDEKGNPIEDWNQKLIEIGKGGN